MFRQLGYWIALTLALGLLAGITGTLSGQTADQTATATAVDGVDMDALLAMSQEQRFDAIRTLERDTRIAVLRQLPRDERKAFRAFRQPTEQLADLPPANDRPSENPPVSSPGPAPPVAGTSIQYDTGTSTGFLTAITSGRFVGNRFDVGLNGAGTATVPVEQTGTITMVTFEMRRTYQSTVTWSLYSDIMGTSAVQVQSVIIPVAVGLNTHTVDPMVTPNVYQNGSFLAGIWQFNTAFTRIASDNVDAGLGFHAVTINEPQTAAPNTGMGLTSLGPRNAVFRVTGNIVTPIELMNFDIE
ncbi:MAG: hypothetical protein AAF604_24700 [Acidobacteriota bacterium]